jgi:hypothetical protein
MCATNREKRIEEPEEKSMPVPSPAKPAVFGRNGRPLEVRLNGRRHAVRALLDCWVVEGRWWTRAEKRVYFRLDTTGGVVEVYRTGEEWHFSRTVD